MKDIIQIMQSLLPVVVVAVINSALTTISVQGFKNFFSVELKGNVARAATVVIAAIWSYIITVLYGGGTIIDFTLVLAMTFLGATGIYEVLMQKKADIDTTSK